MMNIEIFKKASSFVRYSELSEPEIYEYPEGDTKEEKDLFLEYYSDIKWNGISWAIDEINNQQ